MQGVLSVSGVIGTWAGPALAGHGVRDGAPQGRRRRRGPDSGRGASPKGGMGAVSEALRAAALANGATVRTDAPVARIDVTQRPGPRRDARVGRGAARRRRDRGDPPEDHVPRPDRSRARCRPTSSTAIERWKTRSGTVKVNVAVDRLPEFTAKPGFDPEVHGGTIVLAESLDDIEARVPGRGRAGAPRRCRSPTSASRRCSTRRSRRRATTSCRCSRSGCRTRWASTPYADGARRVRRPGDRARRRRRARLHRFDPAPPGDRALRDGARVRA